MNELEMPSPRIVRDEAANPFVRRQNRDFGRIGTQLRRLYDDVADEQLPDRFARLLARLDEQRD
jgi:hypothetical protein